MALQLFRASSSRPLHLDPFSFTAMLTSLQFFTLDALAGLHVQPPALGTLSPDTVHPKEQSGLSICADYVWDRVVVIIHLWDKPLGCRGEGRTRKSIYLPGLRLQSHWGEECALWWRQSNDYRGSCPILELSLHTNVKLPSLPLGSSPRAHRERNC